MADLAELGIIYVEQGWEAAMQHMSDYKDVAGEVVQSEEGRVKAAGKVAQSQAALSEQIAKTTVAFNSSKSAQYEFQAAALGVTDQLQKQIAFLKNLEEQAAFTAEAQKASAQWARQEEGALLDLAKDIQYLNKVRAQEAAEAEANRKKELASRDAYYAKIVADAKAAEQAITDAKHKAILDQQNATAKAAAMYIKDEQDRVKAAEKAATDIARVQKKASDDAARTAEQAAIAEIQWARKSRDEQLRIKEEIATYKKAGVSDATIGNMFGSGALNGSINEVHTLAEKWDHVSMNTSRARSEMVVLAHEIVQGRFSRIPASLMVFAEYTDITALALSGLGLAIMGSVAALVVFGLAIVKGTLEQRELQNALILTGNYAGTTAGQLDAMAHSSVKMGGSLGLAKTVILDLAQSGKFTGTQIAEVTNAVVKMEYATGGGEDSIKGLVDAFKSLQVEANSHSRYSDQITQAVLKQDAQYHFLTTSVLEQIRALESEGKAKEASALATHAFADALTSRQAEMVANLGTIEKGWRSIKESIGEAWSAMKDWGKSDTIESRLKAAKEKLDSLKDPTISIGYQEINLGTEHRAKLREEQQKIVNQLAMEMVHINDRALEQGERAAVQSEANVAYGHLSLKMVQMKADKEGQLAKNIREANSELAKILANPDISPTFAKQVTEDTEKLIESYKKQAAKGTQVTDSYDRIAAAIEAADQKALVSIATGEKVSAANKLRIDIMRQINLAYEDGTLSVAKKEKAIRSLNKAVEDTKAADAAKQRLKDEEDALVVIDKLQDEATKSYNKMIKAALDAAEKTTKSLDAQIAKQIAHNSEIGKTKEQIELARAAREDAEVKELQGEADRLTAMLARNDAIKEEYGIVGNLSKDQETMSRIVLTGLDEEILRRKQLKSLLLEGAVLEANAAAAKLALATWKKGWEDVDKLAQGAFAGWALKGKSAAEMIGEALKTALVDAIYQATLRPIVAQVYVSATSALGIPGVSGGGGTIGSLLNTASSGNSLYNNISGLFGGSSAASSAYGFAGLAGAGNAAGLSATLPALSPLAIESGVTSMGTSIFSIATPATTGVTLGTLAPSLGGAAATTTLGTAVTAPLAAGAAPALGIPGIGWAIGGALLLAGLLGSGGGRYVQSTGETSLNFDESGKETYRAPYRFKGVDEATAKEYGMKYVDLNEGANNFATSLNKTYLSAAKSLGITAAASNFAYGGNDADSSTGQGKFRLGAGVVGGKYYFNSGEIAKSDEALKLAASRAVLTALAGSEMPKYLAGVFDSVGDAATMTQEQIDAVLKTAEAFKNLHDTLLLLPFEGLKNMSYKAMSALVEFSGGLDKFGKNLGTYYDNFYSAEEKKQQTLNNISKRLTDAGIGLTTEALSKMSRADYRSLLETIQGTFSDQASTKMVAALLDMSGAFASITDAAKESTVALSKTKKELLDIASGAATDALSVLTKSVESQKTALTSSYNLQVSNFNLQLTSITTSVGKLQSLASTLKGTLDGLRIVGADAQYRSAAQAQISAALAQARSGGGLPLDGQLNVALQTVSKPSEQLYATFTDYARDFYKTANDIAALSELTGAQLTSEQIAQGLMQSQIDLAKRSYDAQLIGLDETLTIARSQLDAANGINTSVLSVAEAIRSLGATIATLTGERISQNLPTGAVNSSGGFVTVGGGAPVAADPGRIGRIADYVKLFQWGTAETDKASALKLVSELPTTGITQEELSRAMGISIGDITSFFSAYGIPKFDVGTNYIPNDMVAMLHKGEAVVPAAYNPAAGGQSQNQAVVIELQAIRAEMASLRASSADTADNTKRTASVLTNVTHGGEAMQTQVFA